LIDELLKKIELAFPEDQAAVHELVDAYRDQDLLVSIGRSLISEHDIGTLLRLILNTSREITGADAGSIFLVEGSGDDTRLRFKYSQTYSRKLDYEEFTMPRDTSSIAGYVAITGRTLNVDDAYLLDSSYPFKFNPRFDEAYGYRTRSMLVVPMRNHVGDVIGVLQLINSKEGVLDDKIPAHLVPLYEPEDFEQKVRPFKKRYANLMESVASQAAIAIENSRMLARIKEQFESFVRAAVFAVESRDPATSGHSERVARMAISLAKAVSESREGPYAPKEYAPTDLRQIEYAGLLHDFGKVYIDPQVFLKAKKLYPRDFELLMMRLKFLYRSVELGYDRLLREASPEARDGLERDLARDASRLEEVMTLVTMLNEPQPTDKDPEEVVGSLSSEDARSPFFSDIDGSPVPMLTSDEAKNLRIRRGSLNEEERKIIQEHVTHTYNFVSKIPWPDEFRDIPEIAWAHHEMLDGSGYPRGLKGDEIRLEARMLAICDVFDALVASDRPYKRALPFDTARSILEGDARSGKLDAELVAIFFARECWKASAP
jgi:HD-GYP domain-containing protein (c-di-GMP phosphodiesterase class II)